MGAPVRLLCSLACFSSRFFVLSVRYEYCGSIVPGTRIRYILLINLLHVSSTMTRHCIVHPAHIISKMYYLSYLSRMKNRARILDVLDVDGWKLTVLCEEHTHGSINTKPWLNILDPHVD